MGIWIAIEGRGRHTSIMERTTWRAVLRGDGAHGGEVGCLGTLARGERQAAYGHRHVGRGGLPGDVDVWGEAGSLGMSVH